MNALLRVVECGTTAVWWNAGLLLTTHCKKKSFRDQIAGSGDANTCRSPVFVSRRNAPEYRAKWLGVEPGLHRDTVSDTELL